MAVNQSGSLHEPWHAVTGASALSELGADREGLATDEVERRLRHVGPNRLPRRGRPGWATIYLRQFRNPLVYLLVLATAVSGFVGEIADALFILVVLQFNAIIGTLQEWKAQRSADALDDLIRDVVTVRRDGLWQEIEAEGIVPGDIARFVSGARIPADVRLLGSQELRTDESLLTGESTPVDKRAEDVCDPLAPQADRSNMLFAGTAMLTGRAHGVVCATGSQTEVGHIARALVETLDDAPPLIRRLERFSRAIGVGTLVVIVLLGVVQLLQGVPPATVFLVAVALAVAAIPEGLPIAITVALAIATNRMLRRRVIVRSLPAVEGLGACTMIASDKTGTLTCNELVVRSLQLFGAGGAELPRVEVSGIGYQPVGDATVGGATPGEDTTAAIEALGRTAAICNEASLRVTGEGAVHLGDTVDVAFLVLAAKLGADFSELQRSRSSVASIPYEPVRRFGAVFTASEDPEFAVAHVKGAAEFLVPRCRVDDVSRILASADRLAAEGYRVIAVARGTVAADAARRADVECLRDLELLGLAGLIDPVRREVPAAIGSCRAAGIGVQMITGDHPQTALSIARELTIAEDSGQVVTGAELAAAAAKGQQTFDRLVERGRVFARVEPVQKLALVQSLRRAGEIVAVTGDGVNDAPALSAADIGVAMGESGTDVARGASDLILVDDNFASIVGGVEEGRVAHDNVRKLIFLLIATGIGEIVLFLGSIVAGLPIPLFAAQLLWLNLVTNGIQDIALAFEKGEPGVLQRRPRPPDQGLFDRFMVTQVMVSGVYMGAAAFVFFFVCLASGMEEGHARNLVLLLMVMFENAHALNARSETRSVFRMPLHTNWFLIGAILAAHLLHLGVMFVPPVAHALRITPVGIEEWFVVGCVAASLILVMEVCKRLRSQR